MFISGDALGRLAAVAHSTSVMIEEMQLLDEGADTLDEEAGQAVLRHVKRVVGIYPSPDLLDQDLFAVHLALSPTAPDAN